MSLCSGHSDNPATTRLPKTDPLGQLKTFATDVVPEVRRRVGERRGQ